MPQLLSAERRSLLLEMLAESGSVRLEPAAESLGVSAMTVRRDLDDLVRDGLARRVRGGAVAAIVPQGFTERIAARGGAKAEIARKAHDLLPHGGAAAMDASSTVGALISTLDDSDELLVVTNSYDNLRAAQGRPAIDAILLGGRLEPRTGSFVGAQACESASRFHYDRFFTSAAALDPSFGTSETTLEEAEVKRVLSTRADETVVLADSSKLERLAVARALAWTDVDLLVTELDPADDRLAAFRGLVDIR
ncbi:DeoR/GlpR transcriptional regulator [Microbacterium oleivorans]|uniref:DeoR/GlpR family DNA-binding transcription regulator n=1 Tax=Microbacterium oleivorans TaxID=273677 RepID=UPI0010A2BD20|nr:DeoR/GlpR family DNA-binding transcription regulator [Microbacterium oleivorans]THE08637.1 DeoR/GlpR transcriptional regulator [Microbacterium oleivorans]